MAQVGVLGIYELSFYKREIRSYNWGCKSLLVEGEGSKARGKEKAAEEVEGADWKLGN